LLERVGTLGATGATGATGSAGATGPTGPAGLNWFNVSEWSWLPSSGTVIDNSQTGCSSGASSATQTSASVTTTHSNDLIIFADRATENYSSGPTNGFVKTTQSGVEQMLSAYYLPGATGTYSSSFTTVSAATYVTAIVAFRSRTFQRSHINFVK
jgi:hypothetical protein